MRKSKPVIILLAIQLIIALSLAFINPVCDFIVQKKGTEYTFSVDDAWFTGDFVNTLEANCYLDFRFDFDRHDFHPETHAVIATDENGISYISALSETKPESGDWLGTEEKAFDYYCYFSSEKLDYDLVEAAFFNTDLLSDFELTENYDITVSVSVYKGRAVLNKFLVNGIEIEDFINNTEG